MTNLEWLHSLQVDEVLSFLGGYTPKCHMCGYQGTCTDDTAKCYHFPIGLNIWLMQEHKEKLKPCANCGGKAKFFPYKSFNSSDTGCIRCIDCGMRTFTGQKFKVIEIWNRRIDDGKVDGD